MDISDATVSRQSWQQSPDNGLIRTFSTEKNIGHSLARSKPAIAEHSETGLRHLAAIELGEKNPSVDTLYRIIRCIGVSSDRIFYPEQSEHNSDLEDISFLAATCTHKERQMIVAFIRMLLDYRD